jgi:membrane protein implicated in regulation of membrane protease activity
MNASAVKFYLQHYVHVWSGGKRWNIFSAERMLTTILFCVVWGGLIVALFVAGAPFSVIVLWTVMCYFIAAHAPPWIDAIFFGVFRVLVLHLKWRWLRAHNVDVFGDPSKEKGGDTTHSLCVSVETFLEKNGLGGYNALAQVASALLVIGGADPTASAYLAQSPKGVDFYALHEKVADATARLRERGARVQKVLDNTQILQVILTQKSIITYTQLVHLCKRISCVDVSDLPHLLSRVYEQCAAPVDANFAKALQTVAHNTISEEVSGYRYLASEPVREALLLLGNHCLPSAQLVLQQSVKAAADTDPEVFAQLGRKCSRAAQDIRDVACWRPEERLQDVVNSVMQLEIGMMP